MEIYFLDYSFRSIEVVEAFESFIWTERYNSAGDFEMYTYASDDLIKAANMDIYIWSKQSDRMMILDEKIITSDIVTGSKLTLKGRSLESLLGNRIIWHQTVLDGNFQNAIERLLNENVISPDPVPPYAPPPINPRAIPGFIFKRSEDPRITSMTIRTQFTGTNLLTAIEDLCAERNVGFKVILNQNQQFEFSLYMGIDHSFEQTENQYVVFSPKLDNIINSNYLESNRVYKTIALVAGEGEGAERRTTVVGQSDEGVFPPPYGGIGLQRKELYVDARDVSSRVDETEENPEGIMPDEEYYANLRERGAQRLTEHKFIKTFEGDIETTQLYMYGRDFLLGDIVQIVNEFDIESRVRVIEIILSDNNEGHNVVPTFKVVS